MRRVPVTCILLGITDKVVIFKEKGGEGKSQITIPSSRAGAAAGLGALGRRRFRAAAAAPLPSEPQPQGHGNWEGG